MDLRFSDRRTQKISETKPPSHVLKASEVDVNLRELRYSTQDLARFSTRDKKDGGLWHQNAAGWHSPSSDTCTCRLGSRVDLGVDLRVRLIWGDLPDQKTSSTAQCIRIREMTGHLLTFLNLYKARVNFIRGKGLTGIELRFSHCH